MHKTLRMAAEPSPDILFPCGAFLFILFLIPETAQYESMESCLDLALI